MKSNDVVGLSVFSFERLMELYQTFKMLLFLINYE